MSPELAERKSAVPQSDLYSLGAMLYELCWKLVIALTLLAARVLTPDAYAQGSGQGWGTLASTAIAVPSIGTARRASSKTYHCAGSRPGAAGKWGGVVSNCRSWQTAKRRTTPDGQNSPERPA
jgi:serine/threonine protein kinase